MSERIIERQINGLLNQLNIELCRPTAPWRTLDDGTHQAQIGNYHLDNENGGFVVNCMDNETGGVSRPFSHYSKTKAEVYWQIYAALEGVKLGKAMKGTI